jgi:hypothetical protein
MQSTRAYLSQFLLSIFVYLIVVVMIVAAYQYFWNSSLPTLSVRPAAWTTTFYIFIALFAVMPVAPAILAINYFQKAVACLDELQRQIQFEAVAFGFLVSAFVFFVLGLLEKFGVLHLDWLIIAPLMLLAWGLGWARANHKYNR